jgi:hypothetical protein
MDSANRLKLAARITYYLGWITVVCGGLAHFSVGAGMFRAILLPQRNLFEASLILFLISIASAARAATFENAK